MRDKLGRDITYMRISITDRCTLRCRYCMPEEGVEYFPHEEILTFEEILRVAQAAVRIGIHTFRLTGGEPLARRGLGQLIQMLRREAGVERLLMTTNGVGLSQEAHPEPVSYTHLAIMSDHPVQLTQYLTVTAALAERHGLPEREALKAITINAARAAFIDETVGSIEVGKDADLVVYDGDPLDARTRIEQGFINGKKVK